MAQKFLPNDRKSLDYEREHILTSAKWNSLLVSLMLA